jgi:hypothetical protein
VAAIAELRSIGVAFITDPAGEDIVGNIAPPLTPEIASG